VLGAALAAPMALDALSLELTRSPLLTASSPPARVMISHALPCSPMISHDLRYFSLLRLCSHDPSTTHCPHRCASPSSPFANL
jgi:hypothetical protein